MEIVFLNVSAQLGGAERVLIDLLASLRKARPDWHLEVIVGEEGALVPALVESGFRVSVLPLPQRFAALGDSGANGWAGRLRLALSLALALPGGLRYRNVLRAHLMRIAPDVVHTNGFKMHVLGAMALPPGSRLVWHIHDFVRSRPVMRRLLARFSNRPAAFVAVSRSIAADLRTVVRHPDRVHVVLNAVDLDRFSPSGPVSDLDALAQIPPPSGTVRVGFIATFAKWKGHRVFLRALALLPPDAGYHAFIIGGRVYRTAGSQYSEEQVSRMAIALGVSDCVCFTGFLPDMAAAMRDLDIVVHASTEPEPFGLVIAEAMACGRAVIASLGGGAAEILHSGVNGLGHVPGDAGQLANCIERLIRHPELRRAYGAAARQTAEAMFQRDRLAEQLIPLYTAS